MNIGDVVTMAACKLNYGSDCEVVSLSYKAPRGEHFVFLLLGSQPKDGPALSADQVLIDLGWTPPCPPENGAVDRTPMSDTGQLRADPIPSTPPPPVMGGSK